MVGGESLKYPAVSSFYILRLENAFRFLATVLRIHSLPHQNKIQFLSITIEVCLLLKIVLS